MKVVLFCGGLGTRLREHSETIPKPLATIGPRPIIWYLMRYYAHFGHKEFVLCLGYRGEMIKEFFLNDGECPSDWTLHFVETGQETTIADRLRAVEPYLRGEDCFLANYSDGLTDLPLPRYLDAFRASDAVAGFVAVRNPHSFHIVSLDEAADGRRAGGAAVQQADRRRSVVQLQVPRVLGRARHLQGQSQFGSPARSRGYSLGGLERMTPSA